MYYVEISDVWASVDIEIDEDGEITVLEACGCKTDCLKEPLDSSLMDQEIADVVLKRWLVGYEGGQQAAQENELQVVVRDDEGAWLATAGA